MSAPLNDIWNTDLTGRYLKALKDKAQAIQAAKAGDIFQVMTRDLFQPYKWDGKKNKVVIPSSLAFSRYDIHTDRYWELMPKDYNPEYVPPPNKNTDNSNGVYGVLVGKWLNTPRGVKQVSLHWNSGLVCFEGEPRVMSSSYDVHFSRAYADRLVDIPFKDGYSLAEAPDTVQKISNLPLTGNITLGTSNTAGVSCFDEQMLSKRLEEVRVKKDVQGVVLQSPIMIVPQKKNQKTIIIKQQSHVKNKSKLVY